jgi:alpha-1,2-mannosyltransferase
MGRAEVVVGSERPDAEVSTPPPRRRLLAAVDGAVILLLAVGIRLAVVFGSPGGIRGDFGYDSGVYYATGDALVHGRMPYADFVMVHPPGIALATAPFAAIGRLTTDHTGYVLATLAFAVIGGLNALLAMVVARRLGCGRMPALIGALFYAAWYGAVNAEVSIRLEPLGSAAFLTALTLIAGRDRLTRPVAMGAGFALGVACCLKIWWVMPLAIVLGWLLLKPARRGEGAWLAGGALLAAVAIAGPFFVRAPGDMTRMIITDQLGRIKGYSLLWRADDLVGIGRTAPDLHGPAHVLVLVLAALLLVALTAAGWRLPAARPVVVLVPLALLVLMRAPSYYPAYADYLAPALAVTVAAAAETAAQAGTGRQRLLSGSIRAVLAVTVVGAAVSTAVTLLDRPNWLVAPFPGRQLAKQAAHVRCVTSDSPTVLIQLDALSRALENDCPVLIDFTGISLDMHPPSITDLPLLRNPVWQEAVRRYLLAGDATILIRAAQRLDPATIAEVRRHRVIVLVDGRRLYDLHRLR